MYTVNGWHLARTNDNVAYQGSLVSIKSRRLNADKRIPQDPLARYTYNTTISSISGKINDILLRQGVSGTPQYVVRNI